MKGKVKTRIYTFSFILTHQLNNKVIKWSREGKQNAGYLTDCQWLRFSHLIAKTVDKAQSYPELNNKVINSFHFSFQYYTLLCVTFSLFFNWRIIALQNFVVFSQTSTWIIHRHYVLLLVLFSLWWAMVTSIFYYTILLYYANCIMNTWI